MEKCASTYILETLEAVERLFLFTVHCIRKRKLKAITHSKSFRPTFSKCVFISPVLLLTLSVSFYGKGLV